MNFLNRRYLAALLPPLLLLWLVPALRIPAQKLASGDGRGLFPLPIAELRDVSERQASLVAPQSLDAEIWMLSHFRFPARLQKFQSRGGRSDRLRSLGNFLAFGQLAQEHPDNVLLLVCALNWMRGRDGRVAGPWEDVAGWTMTSGQSPRLTAPLPNPSLRNFPTFPASALPPPNPATLSELPENLYLPADNNLGLQLARRGQKLEPNNSFFDWMAARALFALRRDDEALQALKIGSRKTDFDMHWRDLWGAQIRALAGRGPLLPEEKVLAAEFTSLPYINTLYHVRRLAQWSAMQHEEAGDAAGALEIEGDLARLSMVLNRRGFFLVEKLSGAAGVRQAWRTPAEARYFRGMSVGPALAKTTDQAAATRRDSRAFQNFARGHNRPDLARETATFEAQLLRFEAGQKTSEQREGAIFDFKSGPLATIYLSSASALLALWTFGLALILWLFLMVWGPLFAPREVEVPRPNSRFSMVVLGTILSVWLFFAGLQRFFFGRALASGQGPMGRDFADVDAEKWAHWASFAAVAAPFLIGALGCWLLAMRWKRRIPREEARREFSGRELGTPDALMWMQNGSEFARKWLWLIFMPAVALALAGFYALMTYINPVISTSLGKEVTDVFKIAVAAWLVLVFWRARFVGPRAHRGAVFAGFFAFRRVLAWTMPLALWLLIAALESGVSARRQVEAQWQNYVASETQR